MKDGGLWASDPDGASTPALLRAGITGQCSWDSGTGRWLTPEGSDLARVQASSLPSPLPALPRPAHTAHPLCAQAEFAECNRHRDRWNLTRTGFEKREREFRTPYSLAREEFPNQADCGPCGRCKEPVLFKHLGRNHGRFLWHGAGSDASEHPNQEHAGGAYYHTMCLRERERREREAACDGTHRAPRLGARIGSF